MCLFATTQEALIAKEDIKVYKVVHKRGKKYYTPSIYGPLTSTPASDNIKAYLHCQAHMYAVEDQGVHAFTSLRRARKYAETSLDFRIITGVIPAGTRYWKGDWHSQKQVAAKYIKFDTSKEIQCISWYTNLLIRVKVFLDL